MAHSRCRMMGFFILNLVHDDKNFKQIWQLYLTIGICYGLGDTLLYSVFKQKKKLIRKIGIDNISIQFYMFYSTE